MELSKTIYNDLLFYQYFSLQPFPCYEYAAAYKLTCRPKGIEHLVQERRIHVPLKNMFEHTIRRIFDIPGTDLAAQILRFRDLNGGKLRIIFYAGIGPDGSSGMYSGAQP